MQWDIISLSIIFTDDDTRKLISEFQQASFEVQVSFEELQSSVPGDAAGIDAIVKRDSAYAGNVMLFALRLSMRIGSAFERYGATDLHGGLSGRQDRGEVDDGGTHALSPSLRQ